MKENQKAGEDDVKSAFFDPSTPPTRRFMMAGR
jgi:hypothetical protein